jgi:hypothetical protein
VEEPATAGPTWGRIEAFQRAFQASVERVLARLPGALHPSALVICVPTLRGTAEQIRVEPEGAISARALARIEERITEIEHATGDSERAHLGLTSAEIAAAAVAETLKDHGKKSDRVIFCTDAVRTRGYLAVPILEVSRRAYDALPAFRADPKNLRHGVYSFGETVVAAILRDAEEELVKPSPGKSLYWLDPEAIFRRAGTALLFEVAVAGHDVNDANALLDRLNVISATDYERRASRGQIVIVRPDHPAVRQKLRLAMPVPLREPEWARKLLEIASSDDIALLSDSSHIFGVGAVADYSGETEDLFVIKFLDHHKWELRHTDTVLMRVEYGVPGLSHPKIHREAFAAMIRRVLASPSMEVEKRLWRIVEAAMTQTHGTLIVISERAEHEAQRLSGQGTLIEPVVLSDEMVRRVTAIDGAVLLDAEGRCHAIGVILDGRATPDGRPARGARYNSALRYVSDASGATVAVVISEDGRVDMLPEG